MSRHAVFIDLGTGPLQFYSWYPDQAEAIHAARALIDPNSNPEKGKFRVVENVRLAHVFKLTHTVHAEVSVKVQVQEMVDG